MQITNSSARHLVDLLPNPAWLVGPNGKLVHANEAWLAFRGKSLDQEAQSEWMRNLHPEDRERCRDGIDAALASQESYAMECRLRSAGGDYQWLLLSVRPLSNSEDSSLAYLASAHAVSERILSDIADTADDGRFRQLVEGAYQSITVLSETGWEVLYANQASADLWGYERPEDFMNAPAFDVHFSSESRALLQAQAEARKRGEPLPNDYFMNVLRLDGKPMVLQSSTRPIDWGGRDAVVTSSVDVTEREAARAALVQSEQRFRDIVDASSDWFWEMDENLRFTSLSERAEEVGGIKIARLLGKTRWEAVGADQDDEQWRQHRTTLESRQVFRDFRFAYEGADGRNHHVSLSGVPVCKPDGQFAGYRGSASDITAEVTARQEAERARDLLFQTLDGVPAQFSLYDPQDVLVYANAARREAAEKAGFKMSLGLTFEQLVRTSAEAGRIADAIGREDAWIEKRVEQYRTLSGVQRLQYTYPDGSTDWHEIHEHRTADGSTLVTHLDVTDHVVQEEQLRQSQKMEAIGQLTGGVSHDFNNILAIVLGNLDIVLERMEEDHPWRGNLTRATAAVDRGATLCQQMLAFSRKQPLQPKVLDLNDLISGMNHFLTRSLGELIELELIRAAGLWTCEADPTQVENAILNLAINARDAMPEGGKLTIETANARLDDEYAASQAEVEPGQYVMLAVSDTGCGMSEEIKGSVFEPFFTTKEAGRGSGLGLSMVFGFVKQSRGHVTVYSEPGEGTTFRIYLPRSQSGLAPEAPSSTLYEGLEGRGESILVVEDDEPVRTVVAELLETLGYRVTSAGDSDEGAEHLASSTPFDLLITDVVLPGKTDGRGLARLAQEKWPDISILFMSGYSENAVIHSGRLDSDVVLLSKPFRRKDLALKVRQALEGGRPNAR